jgi:YVTN family beta-propeller protein
MRKRAKIGLRLTRIARSRRGWALIGITTVAVGMAAFPGGRPARSARPDLFPLRGFFQRAATYEVSGAAAEIVAVTPDGRTLVYTDAVAQEVGFVDITNPAAPVEIATLPVGGEPTSVAVTPSGRWALVVVAGPDVLAVIDVATRGIVRTIPVGGQPDSIAISGDGRYAAIVIENERDESVNGGRMPQSPAGFLRIVDLVGEPAAWSTRDVSFLNLAMRFPTDPEPEFVDINTRNQAAVTLQENNHVVLVNLADGAILRDWSAGVTSHPADTKNNGDVQFVDPLNGAQREPDAIGWTPGGRLITANEGDYTVDLGGQFAGGRDFTIFETDGRVAFEPGAGYEIEAARQGHYPDARSGSKGVEAEGLEIGTFDGIPYAFVGSERGHFVAVYRIVNETRPVFHQLLPTGLGPEGLLAIPQRSLFVTANETDGTISLYRFDRLAVAPDYPQVSSASLWWSGLSGLAAGSRTALFAVPDSAIRPSRIFVAEYLRGKATITRAIPIAKNYDLEGIALRPGGGWWVVSEGAGSAGQSSATPNLLVRLNADGGIAQEVALPAAVSAGQRPFGFQGVATSADGAQVYVAFQREWSDDPAGRVKIGRYTPATGEWAFYHYPLDAAPSSNAWVGLAEIARLDDSNFLVLERDNQSRRHAQVKRIYRFSIASLTPVPAGGTPPLITKTLVRNLLTQDGWKLEKAEGLTVLPSGRLLVVSDNGGVGETRLLEVAGP